MQINCFLELQQFYHSLIHYIPSQNSSTDIVLAYLTHHYSGILAQSFVQYESPPLEHSEVYKIKIFSSRPLIKLFPMTKLMNIGSISIL